MKYNNFKNSRAFTLIELLVVIAIIGLLSSVVLASLNGARAKAKDSLIKQSVLELGKLMFLEYSDNGSYQNMIPTTSSGGGDGGWFGNNTDCSQTDQDNESFRVSVYAPKAKEICKKILEASGSKPALYVGRVYSELSNPTGKTFTIFAWLPGKGQWFCAGHKGTNSETDDPATTSSSPIHPGCFND